MPTSSSTSRRTASSIVSPGSVKPARHDHMVGANRGERPSTQRSPAIASMITTGSVRGKCSTLQDGQSRRQPPCTTCGRRAAIRDRSGGAHASRAALWLRRAAADDPASTRPCTAMVRRSVIFRSLRALSGSTAAGSRPKPKRGAHPRVRGRRLARAAERARLGGREQRIAWLRRGFRAPPVRRRSRSRRLRVFAAVSPAPHRRCGGRRRGRAALAV